jgi:hypothetical protein
VNASKTTSTANEEDIHQEHSTIQSYPSMERSIISFLSLCQDHHLPPFTWHPVDLHTPAFAAIFPDFRIPHLRHVVSELPQGSLACLPDLRIRHSHAESDGRSPLQWSHLKFLRHVLGVEIVAAELTTFRRCDRNR